MTSHSRPLLFSLLMLVAPFCSASEETSVADDKERKLDYADAVVLGIVEGFTEYLPVSSTGHLIIANKALGLEDAPGGPAEPDAPVSPLKKAADSYCVVIQSGAIAAVAIIYWKDLVQVLLGMLGRSPNGFRLGMNLILAFLPAMIIGVLVVDYIDKYLFSPINVAIALAAGAPLMLGVERWRRRKLATADPTAPEKLLHEISPRQAVFVGLMQCIAMWPGTSRSMMTITAGYLVGLGPAMAARFSFLLGLVTLSAAVVYKLLTDGRQMLEVFSVGPFATGLVVATISAALSVKWLGSFLSRKGLAPFAWYRLVLAVAVLAVFC